MQLINAIKVVLVSFVFVVSFVLTVQRYGVFSIAPTKNGQNRAIGCPKAADLAEFVSSDCQN